MGWLGEGGGEGGLGGGGGERCPRVPLILGQRGREGRGERCDKSGSALPYEKKILKLYLHSCSAVWLPNMGKNGHNKLGKVKIRQNKVV